MSIFSAARLVLLLGGTKRLVPSFRIPNIGTVPTFKINNIGAVPMFKMLQSGLGSMQ